MSPRVRHKMVIGTKSSFQYFFVSESLIADPNCPSELIKNKKWSEIARQAIQGDLKLADMNGHKFYRNIPGRCIGLTRNIG